MFWKKNVPEKKIVECKKCGLLLYETSARRVKLNSNSESEFYCRLCSSSQIQQTTDEKLIENLKKALMHVTIPTMQKANHKERMKTCTKCKETKALSEFHFNSRTPDKRQYYCKVCINGYSAWKRINAVIKKDEVPVSKILS